MNFKDYMILEESWATNIDAIKKFEKTVGKKATKKGFFDACMNELEPKMGDKAKGFCAKIKDTAHGAKHGKEKLTNWRGKGKTEKEAKQDIKQQAKEK